jgi:hypothetical protein
MRGWKGKKNNSFGNILVIYRGILWRNAVPEPFPWHCFLYGCETWSLILREERRLRVFENRVLRRIFGPNMDEVTGERRRLHNEELHILYSSPNIFKQIKSRRMRQAENVARAREERKMHWVLVGNHEGKTMLGRSRRRWEDGIRMDLREIG